MRNKLRNLFLSLPLFEACCRWLTRRHVRAIMYHRFSSQAIDDSRFVDAESLALQLDIIVAHHSPISPDKHHANHVHGTPVDGSCPVVVTVDDGYYDFLEWAHPLMRDRGIPATLFMTTGLADGSFWFWWDKIEFVFNEAPATVHEVQVLGRTAVIDLRSPASRRQAWSDIADQCRFSANDDKLVFIEQLAEALGVQLPESPPPYYRGVTWDELRDLVADGFLVGAHTLNHPILSRISQAEAELEIRGSRDRLEAELGQSTRWFCYPQGGPADYTDAICDFLAEEGFTGSYLAYQISGHPRDPFRMPRYCVGSNMAKFRWVMCGADHLVRRVKLLIGLQADVSESYWGTELADAKESSL